MIVEQLPKFKSDVKYYVRKKKYLTVPKLVRELTDRIELGELPGDKLANMGLKEGTTAYKFRMPNPDAGAGKSNGFRVIYYATIGETVYLLRLYSKKDDDMIATDAEIIEMIKTLR